jgi:hypothetical protein
MPESWDQGFHCLHAKQASGALYRYFLNARLIIKNIARGGVQPFKPGA